MWHQSCSDVLLILKLQVLCLFYSLYIAQAFIHILQFNKSESDSTLFFFMQFIDLAGTICSGIIL